MVEPIADTHKRGARSSVSLVIPCRAEYISLGRLLVGALGNQKAVDEETIADMKLVLTEVCNCFLAASPAQTRCSAESELLQRGYPAAIPTTGPSLRLDQTVDPESWTMVVSNPDRTHRISSAGPCDPAGEVGLGVMIVEALVDSIELSDSDSDGSAFRVVKVFDDGPRFAGRRSVGAG